MRKFLYKYVIPRFYYIMFGINMNAEEFAITETEKCLCLAPHPDDESIGMGGTLSIYKDNFEVICLTDGSRAGSELSKEELIQKRADEFMQSMNIAKIKNSTLLNTSDRKMILDFEKYKNINISDKDYIFIPNILDQHRDHKSTSALINFLLKKPHKKSLKIAFYEVWSTLALPNSFVDISEVVETKKMMIDSHSSQTSGYDYTNKMLSLNSYRGLQFGRNYVESFMVFDIKTFKKILKACSI